MDPLPFYNFNKDHHEFQQLCAVVEGFRSRFGRWPSQVHMSHGFLDGLRLQTPQHMLDMVSRKLALVAGAEAGLVAGDGNDRLAFDGLDDEFSGELALKWFRSY